MGFSSVLYANVALQSAIAGMTRALTAPKDGESVDESSGLLATFNERQQVVKKSKFDALEKKYQS
mgnify:CR=1 FL=1